MTHRSGRAGRTGEGVDVLLAGQRLHGLAHALGDLAQHPGAALLTCPVAEVQRRAEVYGDWLSMPPALAGRLQHRPSEMSGDEQQRVAIARALINEPKILLADEPTGNLDSKNSEIVLQMLRQLNKELGQTIVMITHNPEAVVYFDRVVHMRDGVIVDGIPAD